MRALPSTRELRERLSYNPHSGVFTWLVSSRNSVAPGDIAGTVTTKAHGRRTIRFRGRNYYASRLAWKYMTGKDPSGEIDHRDGDKTNDRFCNLRECSRQDNARNMRVKSNNKSGFKGVSWDSGSGKWRAAITINNRQIHLGLFASKEKAFSAYKSKASVAHGEFFNAEAAHMNIIVTINPDPDGVRCGECERPIIVNHFGICAWAKNPVPDAEVDIVTDEDGTEIRGPLCLAAERKLTALVEAGNAMRDAMLSSAAMLDYDETLCEPWDAALAAIKEER